MLSKQLDYEINELMRKYPKKFWAIFLGCMHKPTSLTEIVERFGFARISLYQHNLVKKMIDLGILKFIPTKNKKIKLYYSLSQLDWLFDPKRCKKLYELLNDPEIREAFDLKQYNIDKPILKDRAEEIFYAIIQIIQASFYYREHEIRNQLIFTMIPHFLRNSHIETIVIAIVEVKKAGKKRLIE